MAAASSFTFPSPKTSSALSSSSSNSNPSHKPSLAFRSDRRSNPLSLHRLKLHAAINEVVEKSSNNNNVADAAGSNKAKSELSSPLAADDVASVSAFITQLTHLVKLVDSRDIVELELKQLDCEVVIRKKEALQPSSHAAAPVMMMQPLQYQPQPQFNSAPISAPSPAAASAPVSAPKADPPTPKSSHPPMKSPMAGTFYRSPAPGAAPFVKVGDKIQKGQVVCIIEAMKLMNEIEAEQSGIIVEIVAEDGKPVSVDTPLFVVEP